MGVTTVKRMKPPSGDGSTLTYPVQVLLSPTGLVVSGDEGGGYRDEVGYPPVDLRNAVESEEVDGTDSLDDDNDNHGRGYSGGEGDRPCREHPPGLDGEGGGAPPTPTIAVGSYRQKPLQTSSSSERKQIGSSRDDDWDGDRGKTKD